MADVVTFDPVGLRIVEIGAGGDNELLWQEVYSEWKAWLLADLSRLGYPAAFRYVGSDPISPTMALGTTFFLGNGWRFRPAELNHRIVLVGNAYTEGGVGAVVVPVLGAFTVNVEMRVSNLIDSPSPQEIAVAVWDEPATSHNASGTIGQVLNLLRKVAANKLHEADGDPGTLILYDDDNTTPLLSMNLLDKDGNAVEASVGAPARRSKAPWPPA